jgi:hypothetical protein
MRRTVLLAPVFLSAVLSLSACGGGSDPVPGTGGGGGGTGGGTATGILAKITACPVISNPSGNSGASGCLKGKFVGKNFISGDECTLEVLDNGSYVYTAKDLTSSVTTSDKTSHAFAHFVYASTQGLVWLVSNSDTQPTTELSVTYNSGIDKDVKAEAKVGNKTSTCTLPL